MTLREAIDNSYKDHDRFIIYPPCLSLPNKYVEVHVLSDKSLSCTIADRMDSTNDEIIYADTIDELVLILTFQYLISVKHNWK